MGSLAFSVPGLSNLLPMVSAGNITGLRCEHLTNPIGIHATKPRLSWYVDNAPAGFSQSGYEIQVATHPELLRRKEPDLWKSGKVHSARSHLIPYGGEPLDSGQRAFWNVTVWNDYIRSIPQSKIAYWEMGLLNDSDWTAQWIGRANDDPDQSPPCLYLRKTVSIKKPVKHARLYLSARGVFEAYFNGERLGEDRFSPGWTEYRQRLEYNVYNVTKQIEKGKNTMGALLGDGWFSGHLLFNNQRAHYGDAASLIGQLVIDYKNGSREVITTDESWKISDGPILESDIYHGEIYDARIELGDWSDRSFNDKVWANAEIFEPYGGSLVGKTSPSVEVIEEVYPKTSTERSPGVWILDLGQNMVGQYRLRVGVAEAGQKIQLRFGEMLDAEGSLYTDNLRQARATDTYICRGGGDELFQPRFTFHGFRYVEITGYPGDVAKDDFVGLVLHTKMERTGLFECSDPLINQLYSNIVWGQKGNFIDIPTDCPQRDERLGWTGDAQVFAPTACFNFNVASFFNRWIADMALAQQEDGAVTDVVPAIMTNSLRASEMDKVKCRSKQGNAAWGDAAVICPWVIYQRYGDKGVLESSWEMMTRWIDYQLASSHDFIRPKTSYGDWLAAGAKEPGEASTPSDLIGTAYFAYTTKLVAEIASLLGEYGAAQKYSLQADEVRAAFNQKYVGEDGQVAGETQTGYLLALAFDLLTESKQEYAINRLVQLVEEADGHLSTGFVGTPLLCPVLTRFGRTEVAYQLLMQKTAPGWLYSVLNGATTMWERWNSWHEKDGFADAGMNSFNHYAYGAIGQWLYSTVAGIDVDPDYPGFERVLVHPQPGGGLTYAKGEVKTPFGWVKSHWRIEEGKFYLQLIVPANSSAKVTLESSCYYDAFVNNEQLEETHFINSLNIKEESVGFTVKSGEFEISIPLSEAD